MNGPDSRVAALDGLLEEAGLDAILVTKDASIAYLSGFWGLQMERFFGVVVKRGGAGALMAPTLDREGVNAAPTSLDRALYPAANSNGLAELFSILGDAPKRVGVEEDHLNFARSKALLEAGYELVPATDLIMRLRAAKDGEELASIRQACTHIEAAYDELWATLVPGMTEVEINARVAFSLMRRGANQPHPHILFGTHSADSHGSPSERKLEVGDVVVADIAAQFADGYWGDLTRCATAGAPSDWAQGAWNVVHEAYVAAVAATRLGQTTRTVDAAQRVIIEAHPEIGACLHGAGHAIGTEVHEPPFLIPTWDVPLVEGMVFTIEPGIYNSEIGGMRLEDDVAVGPDGPVMLSSHPLQLRVLA